MTVPSNKHLTVEELDGGKLVRVNRTSDPFESVTEMLTAFGDVCRTLDRMKRAKRRLLVDTRGAPPRNDPAFEAAFAPVRRRLLGGFEKSAVLVRSTAGRLQVLRHAREDGLPYRAFIRESDALDWLSS